MSELIESAGQGVAALARVRVVLVEPLYGGNIGSVCRAMANMGLEDLALVTPRAQLDVEARKMACNAQSLLASARTFDALEDALADCGRAFGMTARRGLYRAHAATAREAAPAILASATGGTRVALVFGREDKGLFNEEIAQCTDIVQIPTSEHYRSLNLAQAVLLIAYEVFAATESFEPAEEKSDEAPLALRERMFDLWRETLLDIGFMKEDKADHMMMGLRRILARNRFTEDDAHIMMGIARQAQWAARQGREVS